MIRLFLELVMGALIHVMPNTHRRAQEDPSDPKGGRGGAFLRSCSWLHCCHWPWVVMVMPEGTETKACSIQHRHPVAYLRNISIHFRDTGRPWEQVRFS